MAFQFFGDVSININCAGTVTDRRKDEHKCDLVKKKIQLDSPKMYIFTLKRHDIKLHLKELTLWRQQLEYIGLSIALVYHLIRIIDMSCFHRMHYPVYVFSPVVILIEVRSGNTTKLCKNDYQWEHQGVASSSNTGFRR